MASQRKPRPDGQIYCSSDGCRNTFPPRFAGQKKGHCTTCVIQIADLRAARRKVRPVKVSDGDRDIGERERRMTKIVHYIER